MAFVPTVGMFIYQDGRIATTALVKAVDLSVARMWIDRLDGGEPITVAITDRWAEVPKKARLVEAWFIAGPAGNAWSRAFLTLAGALAAKDASSIALIHVNPDGSTETSYFL